MSTSNADADDRPGFHMRVLSHLGLVSLHRSHTCVKLLCLQRFVRLFAYGLSTLILASFLSLVGISDAQIGQFMTLTLIGDVVISFLLALVADALSRRQILAVGSLLVTIAGVVFAFSGNFWILLLGAIVGVISPNGNEIGPFRAIEESSLAHLTHPDQRGEIIAWYLLSGSAGSALGMATCGWVVEYLQKLPGWDVLQVYRVIFLLYAACGLIKFVLTLGMGAEIEVHPEKPKSGNKTTVPTPTAGLTEAETSDETRPLLADPPQQEDKKRSRSRLNIFPTIERSSVPIIISLCCLFALDSFTSGLASTSWITYFFHRKYHIEDGDLGTLFFVANIIAAISMLAASVIAKRLGNVKTMVFTHLPSAIFLALIAVPSDVRLSKLFLLLRVCTQSMDTGPRTAFVAAILLPSERTAMIGTLTFVRALGTSLGPLVTGVLAGRDLFWVAFVCAGTLQAVYDLGMLATFLGHKTLAERETRARESDVAGNREA